jgi:hypothetical protein
MTPCGGLSGGQQHLSRFPIARADERRLIAAWTALGSNAEARRDLARSCLGIIRSQGHAIALSAYDVTREHVTLEMFRPTATHVQELRDLKEAAAALTTQARSVLRALERLHARAERRKWYGRAIRNGRIVGSASRPWQRYARAYARTAELLKIDPCLHFLATTTFELPGRGNPLKRRNGALRESLRSVGLTVRQADNVLAALGWTNVR